MKDWNSAIRESYMALLNTIGGDVQVFWKRVHVPDPGDKYIIARVEAGVEDSDKNSFDGNVSVMVECIAIGDKVANVDAEEFMAGEVKRLINSETDPDLSPDFKCVTTKMTLDQSLDSNTATNTITRRLIRFEHFIGQIT